MNFPKMKFGTLDKGAWWIKLKKEKMKVHRKQTENLNGSG